MIFDLSTLHLGDVLMALPAMRAGDVVSARERHRFPGAPVRWRDEPGGLHALAAPGQHVTDAWLALTGRDPVRHRLLPEEPKSLLVVAPEVAAPEKRWHGWTELMERLAGVVLLGATEAREVWMRALNRAHTVICPDTGTAHMADALGCPRVIALHGVPANWPRCAPYWDRRYCIARTSMDAITVDDVLEVVRG